MHWSGYLTSSAIVKTGLGGRRKALAMGIERQAFEGFSAQGQGFNCEGEAWEAFTGTLCSDCHLFLPIASDFLLVCSRLHYKKLA